ncbi:MAG: hypothetical protein H0T46_11685 [Deltaproteobacteria bacterium]|nr:hypothetical protein [Deltaproteobacteria bacterium]
MVTRAVLVASVLCACSDEVVVSPVIEGPVDDNDASAFPELDEIIMTVAHEGNERDLVSASFSRGEQIAITGAPFGDDLVIHMTGFRGASNVAYGRTCAFHVDAKNAPPTPHLFFSRSVKFANLGVTPIDRLRGGAVSYLGTALILGGDAHGLDVSTVQRYDPLSGALVNVGEIDARNGAVHALVGASPPRVVVIGGQVGGVGAAYLELVDPTRRVERVDDLQAPIPRIGLTATSLTDGRVIVVGGNVPGGPPVGVISELALGTGVDVRTLRAVLAHPRTGHTATRLGDDLGAPVLVAGGLDAIGQPVSIAELFKPLAEELADPLKFAPRMLIPRSRHQAVRMPDGSVLIVGGVDAGGTPITTLERFTLDAGFVSAGDMPETAGITDSTVTQLADGRILITGGRTTTNTITNTAFIVRLDPLDDSVDIVPTDRLAVPRANHQAARLCDGTILITGGTAGRAVAERYNPSPAGRR